MAKESNTNKHLSAPWDAKFSPSYRSEANDFQAKKIWKESLVQTIAKQTCQQM